MASLGSVNGIRTAGLGSTTPGIGNPDLILLSVGNSTEGGLPALMDVVKRTYADDMHFVMSAIIGPIVCLFGMAGNFLSILTWRRPGMGSSTGRYLTGQAVANFSLLLMFLLCDSLQYWCPRVKYSLAYGIFFSYVGFPLFFFSIICSIWFTVGLTVDRYVMVCWITKAKTFCNESRANFCLILISVNSFLLNIPHFATYTPVYGDDLANQDNITRTFSPADSQDITRTLSLADSQHEPALAFVESQFATGHHGRLYEFWVHCLVLLILPWFSVLFMNIIIVFKINRANKSMADKKSSQAMRKSKDSENQVTRLLLSITLTFLVLIGLQCIIHCLVTQQPPGTNMVVVSASYSFGKTGIVFNSSLNFLLYCLSGRRFRIELLKMLGVVKRDLLLSSVNDTSSSNISTTAAMTTTAARLS